MSNLEIQKILKNNELDEKIKGRLRLFLEWNFMTDHLKKLDRIGSIRDYQKRYEKDKVLNGDENLKKMILLKQANVDFIEFLNAFAIQDIYLENLKEIFQSYSCITCSILQSEKVVMYLRSQIDEIKVVAKFQVIERFNQLQDLAEKNRIRKIEKVISGENEFEIERATLEYFGLSNFQVVNNLNKTGFDYELIHDKNDGLKINFMTKRKNLKVMKIILIATNMSFKIPLISIGTFK